MGSYASAEQWADDVFDILDEILLDTHPEVESESVVMWWILSGPAEA